MTGVGWKIEAFSRQCTVQYNAHGWLVTGPMHDETVSYSNLRRLRTAKNSEGNLRTISYGGEVMSQITGSKE